MNLAPLPAEGQRCHAWLCDVCDCAFLAAVHLGHLIGREIVDIYCAPHGVIGGDEAFCFLTVDDLQPCRLLDEFLPSHRGQPPIALRVT